MQPNQQPTYPTNQPSAQGPSGGNGAWDFLNTPAEPPKKKSLFARNKKLFIIAVSAIVILVVLAVVAATTAPQESDDSSTNGEKPTLATTSVPLTKYDGQYFSVDYASSLKINIDEALEDPDGWFLHFAEDPEFFTYDIAVQAGDEQPAYENGTDAIEAFLAEEGYTPTNVITPAVVLAGVDSIKTVGEYTDSSGSERYVVYATAQVGDKYVIVNGTYPKDNTDIVDSFDAMIGSIKLK